MTVRTNSKIGFKFGSDVITLDFISLRSDMLLINSREVEFLPEDTIETRWNKITKATEKKSAALSLFEDAASAADDGAPPEGMSVMRTNVSIVNALALSMESAAKDQTQCSSDFQYAYTTCVERTTQNQATFALTAPAPSTAAAKCSPSDTADLTQAEVDKVKAMKSNPAFAQQGGYFGDRARVATTMPFKEPQVSALVKDGSMDLYMKWKLQTVRNALQSLPTGDTDANCKTKLNSCLHDLITSVKEQTNSASMKCYMDKVASDVASGPRAAAPAGGAGSGQGSATTR